MKKVVFLTTSIIITQCVNAQTLKEAVVKTDNERFESAASDYRALIAKEPTKGDNYFYFGENYFRKGDLDSANLSKIENNKSEFDEKRLELLAKVFNLDLSKLRTEFFSDIIAKKIYSNNCDSETLILAEQKVEYLKTKNLTGI